MDRILAQAMKFQLVKNMMLKSALYSPHLLKNLAFRFSHDILEQACFICSFPVKVISATTKPRIFLEVYLSKGVFLLYLFGVLPTLIYILLLVHNSYFPKLNYKEDGVWTDVVLVFLLYLFGVLPNEPSTETPNSTRQYSIQDTTASTILAKTLTPMANPSTQGKTIAPTANPST
jgi:hypothetical protein